MCSQLPRKEGPMTGMKCSVGCLVLKLLLLLSVESAQGYLQPDYDTREIEREFLSDPRLTELDLVSDLLLITIFFTLTVKLCES